ncbi:MAG: hypothetical protein ACJAYE_003178 [Candidatus Azotimanducaceae bacterium]
MAQRDCYQQHLGFNTDEYGVNFAWRHVDNPEAKCFSRWSPFKSDTTYFEGEFMINYLVDDLDSLLDSLRIADIEIIGEVSVEDHCIELWGSIDSDYEKILEGVTNESLVIKPPCHKIYTRFGRALEYFPTRGII